RRNASKEIFSQMIKYLLFDLDGTLFDFHKAEHFAFKKVLEEFSINMDFSKLLEIYSKINLALWKKLEKKEISSDKLRIERFARLLNNIGLDRNPAKMSEIFTKQLSESNFIIDGAVELLDLLKDDFRMTLITNGLKDVQHNRLKDSPIKKYFEAVTISDEVGTPKPNPEIFEDAMQKIGNPPKNEVLIIGDSASSDILGGYNFGIKTCWYNPENNEFPYDFKPDFEINNITKLKEKL
ncbi:MAG: YjjG family noncanonical pyrimidine nucleotidase, partial [Candidatus Cloacimonadota bacterium]|nr:YjjG family noncanonical pyrimidine nucleotidase [Candidatus Cloacimonadota bacterium]